jgi:acetyl-CoA carboxylase / biotin carboxylase 1
MFRSSSVRTEFYGGFISTYLSWTAAYELYVHRAYRAYTLLSLDYGGDGDGEGGLPSTVTWRFKLGQSSSPLSLQRLPRNRVNSRKFIFDCCHLMTL